MSRSHENKQDKNTTMYIAKCKYSVHGYATANLFFLTLYILKYNRMTVNDFFLHTDPSGGSGGLFVAFQAPSKQI